MEKAECTQLSQTALSKNFPICNIISIKKRYLLLAEEQLTLSSYFFLSLMILHRKGVIAFEIHSFMQIRHSCRYRPLLAVAGRRLLFGLYLVSY